MSPITPVNRVSNLTYNQKEKNKQEAQSKLIKYTLEYIMKNGGNQNVQC